MPIYMTFDVNWKLSSKNGFVGIHSKQIHRDLRQQHQKYCVKYRDEGRERERGQKIKKNKKKEGKGRHLITVVTERERDRQKRTETKKYVRTQFFPGPY